MSLQVILSCNAKDARRGVIVVIIILLIRRDYASDNARKRANEAVDIFGPGTGDRFSL